MRGIVDELTSAAPIALQLPAVLQDDEFAQRFVSAFDVALAPIIATLDDLAAYVDPRLAPDDFLDWLAGWVGVEYAAAAEPPVRRAAVAEAVARYRSEGTAANLRDAVAAATGGEVEVTESGAATWSATPGTALPGEAGSWLRVRVQLDATHSESVDLTRRRVQRLVGIMKPAHVVATVEVNGA